MDSGCLDLIYVQLSLFPFFLLLLFLALLFGWFIFNLFEAFEYNFLNLWKIILLF